MAASFFNPAVQKSLLARIENFQPTNQRLWGKMDSDQVLCHLADQIRFVLGERLVQPKKTGMPLWLLKIFVFHLKWPKNSPTVDEWNQVEGLGTPPAGFEKDKIELLRVAKKVADWPAEKPFPPHPAFGPLSREQWGQLVAKHLDWHLTQFSA